ncbi:hypothetical protein M514_08603 [Trichuris suis]|uniref:Uncharacterized protein n=1 Tax=Trichuris suis TaxID=68888 RepID=A0A085MPJ0_9BILA|nr:hypothetical protein M513_08603 [Trichuris suis]KFD59136.1 hypothetical protein M514_08603 [Trichuris suis]
MKKISWQYQSNAGGSHLAESRLADRSYGRQVVWPTGHLADWSFERQVVWPRGRLADTSLSLSG